MRRSDNPARVSDYYEHEKKDLTQIPLYKILKIFKL